MTPRDVARDAVDAALEFSVVGSFSRVGPAIRRRLFEWTPIDDQRVRGQVAVVTGATSGLGLECATALARLGARVILLVRDAELGARVCARIAASTGNDEVSTMVCDLGDLESVRRAAQALGRLPAVHVLVHNAGALSTTFDVSAQGIERTAAVQLVGPFLLTTLIRDQLRAGCARVVWVTSGGMYTEALDVDWLESPANDYDGVRAYARVETRPGVPVRVVGPSSRAVGDHHDGDASGLGGHPGPSPITASLRSPHGTPASNPRPGRRHHPLADFDVDGPDATRRAVAGSPGPTCPSPASHATQRH